MKVFVKTFGCTLNQGDSEVIKGLLCSYGHEVISSESEADCIIVNSCGVKTPTQNKVVSYVRKNSVAKSVIVGGCLPKMIDIKKLVPSVLSTFDANSITSLKELLTKSKNVSSDVKENRVGLPRIRINKYVAIIPIAQGCLGKPCSYCSVKFARGDLTSYKKEDVVHEVKRSIIGGCKIIKLTAQDVGCWGKDFNDSLPNLLNSVLGVEGNFKVRVGMMNPNHVLGYVDDLIEIYKDPKVVKFLHIPLQSGSDKVLKDMRREYSVEDFKMIVNKFRRSLKKICISTDVIVGYPSETFEDFEKTLALVKEVKPEVLNISRFAPRPGTEASKLPQLDSEEIKKRSKILFQCYKNLKIM